MAKALTKAQIVAQLATKSGVTKKLASDMLEHLATLAYKEAKNSFTVPGLGKLVAVSSESTDRQKSSNRTTDHNTGEESGEIPGGQSRERCHCRQEVTGQMRQGGAARGVLSSLDHSLN